MRMRKGIINKGLIKKTNKQEKKHYTQLSNDELDYLEKKLKSIKKIYPSWHLVEKEDISVKKRYIKGFKRLKYKKPNYRV